MNISEKHENYIYLYNKVCCRNVLGDKIRFPLSTFYSCYFFCEFISPQVRPTNGCNWRLAVLLFNTNALRLSVHISPAIMKTLQELHENTHDWPQFMECVAGVVCGITTIVLSIVDLKRVLLNWSAIFLPGTIDNSLSPVASNAFKSFRDCHQSLGYTAVNRAWNRFPYNEER